MLNDGSRDLSHVDGIDVKGLVRDLRHVVSWN